MRQASHVLCTLVLALPLPAQERTLFRQWMGSEEVGTLEVTRDTSSHARRERLRLARLGMEVQQEYDERATRDAAGRITFTWTVRLAQEPMRGEATWSPAEPARLQVRAQGAEPRSLDVPANGVLWPAEHEARLRECARTRTPIRLSTYAFSTQQWSESDLAPQGPDPLPGYPDTVRYAGVERRGELVLQTEMWISPTQGEVKTAAELMGIRMVSQRSDLPAPAAGTRADLFSDSLKPLPRHPFLSWLDILTVRFTGAKPQTLPEDPQQRQLERNRYCLLKAALPSAAEAGDRPVKGKPRPEDAPFLAPTPLLDFRDPAFEGLLFRLRAPREATRWELAKRVTRFVFDWIQPKDFSVGFATAQEVARNARGDCTEHGVLAVALLRRLGVPARGVVGWVALKETLGLHFWVEVNVGGRWIPVDPTFDEAPASAFRIKLGTTDLADLGSVGWDTAATVFGRDSWIPETGNGAPWGESGVRVEGDTLVAPGGIRLTAQGGAWRMRQGELVLDLRGRHGVEAVPPQGEAAGEGLELFRSAATGLEGWWNRRDRTLLVTNGRRWLRLGDVDEATRHELLDRLRIQEPAR